MDPQLNENQTIKIKPAVRIYWDLDNVPTHSIDDRGSVYKRILAYTKEVNLEKILVFTSISHYVKQFDVIVSNFVGVAETYSKSYHGKNLLDTQIMTSVIWYLETNPEMDEIVIVSGDGDFEPLVKLIKKHGITLRIISNSHITSNKLMDYVI